MEASGLQLSLDAQAAEKAEAEEMSKGIEYFHMGSWPMYVGFTQNERAFAREMKRLKIADPPEFVRSGSNACTHSFENQGELTCIITLGSVKGKSVAQIAALIAHEAVHVAQQLWDSLGERKPGAEAEAYLVQHIVQRSLSALHRKPKK